MQQETDWKKFGVDSVDTLTESQLAEWYIATRDFITEQKRVFEDAIAPSEELKNAIEDEMRKRLNAMGATSLRTPGGTIVQSTRKSFTAEDKNAFGNYIIQSGDWEATSLKPTKEYIEDYMRNNDGALPPGVALYSQTIISFKKPTK